MTKSNSIAALRERDQNELADKIQKKQVEVNRRTIGAFRQKFDFCPVYFFFSDYTQPIKNKQLNKVVFLNDNLEPDSSIQFDKANFLIAEFGRVEQDTAKYRDGYYYYKDENGLQRHSSYYAGPGFGFDALVIKSDQFVQMRFGCFPYHVRTWGGIRGYGKAVAIIDKRLQRFYNRHSK